MPDDSRARLVAYLCQAGLSTVRAHAVLRDYTQGFTGLIDDLRDPDPCYYDHHGYCQAHGWMATEPACPHARARELLDTGGHS